MKIRLYILLALTLVHWTCAKLDNTGPEPSPDPVFMVGFRVDGAQYSLTAGLQETYMFTRAEQGDDEVWRFSGSFADAGCPALDCPGTLTFIWRNFAPGNNFDSTWATGTFPLYHPAGSPYQTDLTLLPGTGTFTEVVWNIGDTLQLTGAQQSFLSDGDQVQISTQALFQDGHFSQSSQWYYPVESRFCTRCSLLARQDSTLFLTLTAIPLEPGPHTFLWHTGETTSTILANYDPLQTYAVTITPAGGGCTASAALGGLPSKFSTINSALAAANSRLTAPAPGPVIEWIDPQGNAWRSDRFGPQAFPANFFEVLEVADYLKNENGLPTKKLRVAWNCRVYNESGDSKEISGEGMIGLGWRE